MTEARLQVTVTALQRLSLGVASEVSYFTDAHNFVPGSVMRGALAAAWIAESGPPSTGHAKAAEFRDLFDGDIRYGALYVPGSRRAAVSVLHCKYKPEPACQQVLVDAAFSDVQYCTCGAPLEPGKGELRLPDGVAMQRVTRTSIDPQTGRAEDGRLYAHAALPAGTTLVGFIDGWHEWLQPQTPRLLRLGGRRTVGGTAQYHTVPSQVPPAGAPPPTDGRLVLRLESAGIFVDVAGRPRLDPDPVLDLRGAKVRRSWARPQSQAGWHAASGLPKPPEICAVAGSTYEIVGEPAVLAELSAEVTGGGIGLRRGEGFGAVTLVGAPDPAAPRPPKKPPATSTSDPWAGLPRDEVHRRWLVGALRSLQIEQQRAGGLVGVPADALDALLAQPTPAGMDGRMRDTLRARLLPLTSAQLRDLTTVLAASGADHEQAAP